MKTYRILITIIVAATILLSGLVCQATVSTPTFTFNENGKGLLELPNGAVVHLTGVLATDPGPGGLLSALVFTTHPQEGAAFTVGDVLLTNATGGVSDVLRFDPAITTGTGLSQQIFFYSNDAGGLSADTGLPTAFYPNVVSITENENVTTTFIPNDGQPGFLPVAPVPITYRIISLPDSGSALLLLWLAVSGLTIARRMVFS